MFTFCRAAIQPLRNANIERASDELAYTLQHSGMPEFRIATTIAAFSNQAIAVAHVLDAQQI